MKRREKEASQAGLSTRSRLGLFACLLFVLTTLAYAPAWNGKPIWDDDAHLTKPSLRSWHGLAEIWTRPGATQQYYPVVHSAFWIGHKTWGDATWPYHLLNISLHALAALLLFKILQQLKVPGAWLAAAIFALHPVHVESVAWISELKNTLSGIFFLSAAAFYLRFDESRNRSAYFVAFALFLFGLLSKTVIATLPAALLVVFWWRRGKLSWQNDVLPLLPFFALGISAGIFTSWMERKFIGAEGDAFSFGFVERLLIAGRAFWFYLGKLFWPSNLTFIYPRWQISTSDWWQYFFPATALLIFGLLWLLRKRWRGPLAALLLFAGILFPALGFVNAFPFIYSFVADHFQYLASIAIITLIAAGWTLLLRRWQLHGTVSGYALCLIPLAALAILTWRQCRMYSDGETLYRTTLTRNPKCWMAHNNLGNTLVDQGHPDEAILHCEEALRLRSRYPEAHVTLGNALLTKNLPEEASLHYEAALAMKPDYARAHSNFGNALVQLGRYGKAIAQYQKGLELDPHDTLIQNNLAWMLATCSDTSLRDGAEALTLAAKAERASGGKNPMILHTLAAAYAQAADFPKAIETAQRALHLAEKQGNNILVGALHRELAIYESHLSAF